MFTRLHTVIIAASIVIVLTIPGVSLGSGAIILLQQQQQQHKKVVTDNQSIDTRPSPADGFIIVEHGQYKMDQGVLKVLTCPDKSIVNDQSCVQEKYGWKRERIVVAQPAAELPAAYLERTYPNRAVEYLGMAVHYYGVILYYRFRRGQ